MTIQNRFNPKEIFGEHYVGRNNGCYVVKKEYFDLFLTEEPTLHPEIEILGSAPMFFVREDGHGYPVEAYFGLPKKDGTIRVIRTTIENLEVFCNWEIPDTLARSGVQEE